MMYGGFSGNVLIQCEIVAVLSPTGFETWDPALAG
jgi:hypothetical protein